MHVLSDTPPGGGSRAHIRQGRVWVSIPTSRNVLARAYQLVYKRYLHQGYIVPSKDPIVYNPRFGLPTSRTMVAHDSAGRTAGTVTMVGDGRRGLCVESTFPAEVQSLRDQGRTLAEATCLAIEPKIRSRPREVFFALSKFLIHYTTWADYDDLLLAIHPHHNGAYQRILCSEIVSSCRPHASVLDHPAVLHRINLRTFAHKIDPRWRRHYFSEIPLETEFRRPGITQLDHAYFCQRAGIVATTGKHRRAG